MKTLPILLTLPTAAAFAADLKFEKKDLTPYFWAEGATFGDFNKDGKLDVVAGPYWYEAPDFTKKLEIMPATQTFEVKNGDGTVAKVPGFEGSLGKENKYADNFFAFTYDFNSDGWSDILIIGFPGQFSSWYENPRGKEGHWPRHVVLNITDNESRPSRTSRAMESRRSCAIPPVLMAMRNQTGVIRSNPGPGTRSRRKKAINDSPMDWAWVTSTATAAKISSKRTAGGSSPPR